jgi:hypothetical protein
MPKASQMRSRGRNRRTHFSQGILRVTVAALVLVVFGNNKICLGRLKSSSLDLAANL